MSHPARLTIRPPPHLPFIQGHPGIPGSPTASSPPPHRQQAGIHGSIELRIGQTPVQAKWVRVELRRHEVLPPGFPSSSQGDQWEHVGEINTLWQAASTTKAGSGGEWETLSSAADFKFFLPLPEGMPPSVEMVRGGAVRYELVAALCYRQKGGMFKKDTAPILKVSEHIRIIKHELHSAWPLYNIPDTRSITSQDRTVTLTVSRPCSAVGPGDRILLTTTLKSSRPQPFKLKGFECHLHEVVTALPVEPPASQLGSTKSKRTSKAAQQKPVSKSRIVCSTRCAVDESVGRGSEKSARIEMIVPIEGLLVTVKRARSMEVDYELEVKAVCEGLQGQEVKMGGIKYVVGAYGRQAAQQLVREIGHFEPLCPGGPSPSMGPSRTTSPGSTTSAYRSSPPIGGTNRFSPPLQPLTTPPNGVGPPFPPNANNNNTSVQGFMPRNPSEWRRKSSGTNSTMTTTTMTATTHDFNPQSPALGGGGGGSGRPYSTMPNQRQGPMAFPTASPAPTPGLARSTSMQDSLADGVGSEEGGGGRWGGQSDMGHGGADPKRYSTGTTATFGRWDRGLRTAMGPQQGTDTGTLSSLPESRMTSPTTPTARSTISGASPAPSPAPPTSQPTAHPPSSFPSAEQEKLRLYATARQQVARAQPQASMVPSDAPPDYEVAAASGPGPATLKQMPKEYMSAAEEKERQRKRFEEAQQRVVSGASSTGGGPSAVTTQRGEAANQTRGPPAGSAQAARTSEMSPNPASTSRAPGPGPSPSGAAIVSGLSEKEQMRRYYEAQDRVARRNEGSSAGAGGGGEGGGTGGTAPSSPSAVQPTPQASPPTPGPSSSTFAAPPAHPPVNEKEQMRLYYEAQDRVARRKEGSSSLTASSSPVTSARTISPPPSSAPIAPTPGPTAAPMSEKEQMRRYYEAQDRVAAAASPGAVASGSQPVSNPATAPTSPKTPDAHAEAKSVPKAKVGGPVSEKEQMRLYYEALDRQNRRAAESSSSAAGPGPSSADDDQPPPFEASPSTGAGPSIRSRPGIGAGGALSEKEQMRRYYEAVERVNRQASGSSPPQATTSSLPQSPSTPQASSSSNQPQQQDPPSKWTSAQDEKEMMRKRFEEAQAAVERRKVSGGGVERGGGVGLGISKGGSASSVSGSGGSGVAGGSSGGGGPPPLPKKPPKEYIHLLSPTSEAPPAKGFFPPASVRPLGEALGEDASG